MPERIQLRRTKGWRKPDGAIVVARPTRWGNPWRVGEVVDHPNPAYRRYAGDQPITAGIAVGLFRMWTAARYVLDPDTDDTVTYEDLARKMLAGHDLACWCPPGQPCHADVLLELANAA